MKIIAIFEPVKGSLLSVQYDDKYTHEFNYLMESWSDVQYLRAFFNLNKTDLQSGFYGEIAISTAIKQTIEESGRLETKIRHIAEKGKLDKTNTLQTLFKPLNNNEYQISRQQKSKLPGINKNSWLRIYAIRIAPNLFVVSGGAIKLTETMEEAEHLKTELYKLELTKNYLKEIGLLDEGDYEYLEL